MKIDSDNLMVYRHLVLIYTGENYRDESWRCWIFLGRIRL